MLIEDTISEFGNSMEIPDLSFDDSGKVCLYFDQIGLLYLERIDSVEFGDPELLVYLARDHGVEPELSALTVLRTCHFEAGHELPVNVGIGPSNQVVFSTRLPEHDVSLPSIETALQLLSNLHDSLEFN